MRPNMANPKTVTADSSKLIINMLSEYCQLHSDQPLSMFTMAGLCQGLCRAYRAAGHETVWQDENGVATGNPLLGNVQIDELKKNLRVRLSQVGCAPMKARPITLSQICHHAEQFWYGSRTAK